MRKRTINAVVYVRQLDSLATYTRILRLPTLWITFLLAFFQPTIQFTTL